jgi:2-oxoglutarate dehydrogenase E2 component (dihydrolipoamide succinyltransferase)
MAKVEVTMPKMGESITEGTIIAWHKAPGDPVEQDETLLEIGTDKVDTEVPSPAEGVLLEQLVEEGDTVDVGTVIATLETEAEAADAAPEAGPSDEASAEADVEDEPEEAAAEEESAPVATASTDAAAEPAAQEADVATAEAEEPAPSETTASGGGEEIEVIMPKMGESITEGTIIAWYKEPGDPIDLDETLLEIGTDKVDTEVPSPAKGVLKERLVEEGDTVEVGTKIAIIGAEAEADGAEQPADTRRGSRRTGRARIRRIGV